MEDGAIALERLEDELLGDHEGDPHPIHTSEMPPQPPASLQMQEFFL